MHELLLINGGRVASVSAAATVEDAVAAADHAAEVFRHGRAAPTANGAGS